MKRYAALVLMTLLLLAGIAAAEINPGSTGSTTGTIREITSDFVLVQAQGEPLPRRYYFSATDASAPDASLKSALAGLHEGDQATLRWTYGTRYTLTTIAAAPQTAAQPPAGPVETLAQATAKTPAQTPAVPQASEPAAPSTIAPAEQPHLGERVNEMIDDLAATADRLLEMPLFVLLIGLGIPAIVVALLIARFLNRRPRLARGLVIAEGALLLLFLAILADRRIARLQDELRDLRTKANANALTSAPAPAILPNTPNVAALPARTPAAPAAPASVAPAAPTLDLAAARKTLQMLFRDVTLEQQGTGTPLTLVQLQSTTPQVKAFISIIDLTYPGVKVKIGADLNAKSLTSQFAQESNCLVAINGEAGSSPALGAPLGEWTGHLVRDGEVLLRETAGNPRPFLSFDRQGKPHFISAARSDRSVPADAYNVLWGRWDVLVNSQIQASDFTRQPRTGMALNKDGTRLFLFVGDGRQPRYSVGFTRAEVGNILRALGASDGMLCDEGGSSCMYLQSLGRVVNIPSDNMGRERPVYTHFGITLK